MTNTRPGEAHGTPSAIAADAPVRGLERLAGRIRRSFVASAGSIVFGMEDGTVSIFGLVFGVAAAAPDSHAVLLAGGTGAVAAAVSMMAGTYLDVESTNDQAAARPPPPPAYGHRDDRDRRDRSRRGPGRRQAHRLSAVRPSVAWTRSACIAAAYETTATVTFSFAAERAGMTYGRWPVA